MGALFIAALLAMSPSPRDASRFSPAVIEAKIDLSSRWSALRVRYIKGHRVGYYFVDAKEVRLFALGSQVLTEPVGEVDIDVVWSFVGKKD